MFKPGEERSKLGTSSLQDQYGYQLHFLLFFRRGGKQKERKMQYITTGGTSL